MTVHYADPELGINVPMATADAGAGEKATKHAIIELPADFTDDTEAIKVAVAALAAIISAGRLPVDLAATPAGNLATLAGAISAARMAVDLPATPTANLATLAGTVATGRVAVDLAATPTANLATVASAIANLATIVANQAPPSAIYGDKKTVATAGTRVVLASSQALTEGVWVRALDANTGLIYVGNSSVSATAGGTRLAAKEPLFIRIANLASVYIDSAVNGEGVTYLGW
jgi:hypothetical protein